jgi:hypothetical protein
MKRIAALVFLAGTFHVMMKAQDEQVDHYETVVYATDIWRYFPGTTDPGTSWKLISFEDSSWPEGQGGIGYADNDDNTVIDPVISLFMRIHFIVTDTSKIKDLLFHMDYDDGFIAYINGTEIARAGLTGNPPAYDALANNHEAEGQPVSFQVNQSVLIDGDNLLAVEVHNSSPTSTDMSAIPYLSFGMADTSITYRPVPAWFQPPFVFSESNLPVVIIETADGVSIPDEPKVAAHMKIIDNVSGVNKVTDPANDYDGLIGIELRGAYSQRLPQKPYGLETRDSLGQNNNVSVLGLPVENDWILLANYNEKTFVRNPISFYLFRKMGHYAPRSRLCEVVLNGSYDGIYLFTEKIKRDNDRIDIARLDPDDNAGDSLTGGYIFKIDYYSSSDSWLGNYSPVDYPGAEVHYVYHDPAADELTVQQKNYIRSFVNTFETILYSNDFRDPINGYRNYLHVQSFIDYFIIGELSRNVDAYKKSRFYYKDRNRNGGFIHSGPVWDFDWAWLYLVDGCPHFGATDCSGWAYRIDECSPQPSPSGWIVRLMQDEQFVDAVYTRYFELRENILSNQFIHHYIDSVAGVVKEAQARHYLRWDILGRDVGAPEHSPIPATYAGEIERLKEWIDKRLTWLDANMPGSLITSDSGIRKNATDEILLRLFPNPATDYVYIESDRIISIVSIFNTYGLVEKSQMNKDGFACYMDISHLQEGLYFISVTFEDNTIKTARFVINQK